jgi:hypothetical protein
LIEVFNRVAQERARHTGGMGIKKAQQSLSPAARSIQPVAL